MDEVIGMRGGRSTSTPYISPDVVWAINLFQAI